MSGSALMQSGIRDNHSRGCVGEYLRASIQPQSELSVVSAFFTVHAYDALKSELDAIAHMDFLFGEPRFIYSLDPDRTEKKSFIINGSDLQLANVLQQKRVARECAEWIRAKVSIRSVRQRNFLHGKMYYIAHERTAQAMLGSSNFTPSGLGLTPGGGNIELNLIVDSDRDRQDLKAWFDALWHDDRLTRDVKDEVLRYLAQIYQNHSPEFIYFKTLFEIFKEYLEAANQTDLDLGRTTLFDTDVWKTLFEFQKDGVKGAINKILRHNGCIVADSTGLGKTYTALAIIKYFELKNERVLVICPKKLRQNWTVYPNHADALNPFSRDRFNYHVLSHTDLSRERGIVGDLDLERLNWGNYDLVVIDESHNFRNNLPGKKDEEGNLIRKSRYMRLMDDIIKSGVRTKVLLLSATPVNNDLKDLRNQLYFISAGEDDYFANSGIPDLKETLRKAQGHFTAWSRLKPDQRKVPDLLARLGSDFFKILDGLTIARARKHIQRYYAHEMTRLGGFPKRSRPRSESPEIDSKGRFMSYDKLSAEISNYKLSLFKPSTYLRDDLPQAVRDDYARRVGNFTQAQREDFLIGMMKVNFLKRLESSVTAFALTMERTIGKIESLEARLNRFLQLQEANPDLDLAQIQPEELAGEEDDEIRDALEVGKKLVYKLAHLDIPRWLDALHHDKQQLNALFLQARDVSPDRDEKLRVLKTLIAEKVRTPRLNRDGQPNRKVLVFTAFADTARYLYDQLHQWAREDLKVHAALVVGSGPCQTTYRPQGYSGFEDFDRILTNFSPVSKHRRLVSTMPQQGEIDLLIATDCISEGQNLQDCDLIVNYDVHWNPVRIIQRFGRIDRIGSRNEVVQLVNFWPTKNLDNYINLKHRVEARMALVDVSATQEDNLLTEGLEDLISEDLRYRDRQLRRLKDEILDLEDLNESLSLTEFNLDDFRVELLKFLENNRALLEEAPDGLYTVVPAHEDLVTTVQPGVIYSLRQKSGSSGGASGEQINPLQPHYLVYVHSDGNVRLNFIHPKQILNLYRLLCSGKQVPHDDLCALFDQQTQDGNDMSHYAHLLQRCVDAITATFQRRMASGLQESRDFKLPTEAEQVRDAQDFELVTWLVINGSGVTQ